MYISDSTRCSDIYNDKPYTINKSFKKKLVKILNANGMKDIAKDYRLLNHFAYLFIREHPVIFQIDLDSFFAENPKDKLLSSDKLEDNQKFLQNTNIFEAVQSTNWNNVRFKPSNDLKGSNSWLVEFRPMDLPITNREKSYLIFFVTLLHRIITDPKIYTNFYIPVSKADKNFLRCVERGAVTQEKFFFRRNFFGPEADDKKYMPKSRDLNDIHKKRELFLKEELVELTLQELFEGGENRQSFKGLLEKFIEINQAQLEEESTKSGENIIFNIWDTYHFLVKRAKGELLTNAKLIRNFIQEHPKYNHDSIVEGVLADDLIEFILTVQKKNHHDLLFDK